MNKQAQILKANKSTQEAIKMYEEGERCRRLAQDKRNWRNAQLNWAFMDTYYSIGDYYNHDAQMYYKLALS